LQSFACAADFFTIGFFAAAAGFAAGALEACA
jgi:hypothetical protein